MCGRGVGRCWGGWWQYVRKGRWGEHRNRSESNLSGHPAQTGKVEGKGTGTRSSALAEPLLCRTRAVQPGTRLACGNHQPPQGSPLLTGEPDAGNPPVRFGGRGGANQCAIPTSIVIEDFAPRRQFGITAARSKHGSPRDHAREGNGRSSNLLTSTKSGSRILFRRLSRRGLLEGGNEEQAGSDANAGIGDVE